MKPVLLLFIMLGSVTYSQDTTSTDKPFAATTNTFHPNGTQKIQKIFEIKEFSERLPDFSKLVAYTEYYDNGQLRLHTKLQDSELHGTLVAYWKNGKLKRKDLYNKGTLVEGKCLDQKGNEIEYFKFEIPTQMIED